MNEIFFNKTSFNNYTKCHIITKLFDKDTELIVYKWYSYHKKEWMYKIETLDYFNLCFLYKKYSYKIKENK